MRQKIQATIAPYRKSTDEKPPFTMPQLVMMAVTLTGQIMSAKDIHSWTIEILPYHCQDVVDRIWGYRMSKHCIDDVLTEYKNLVAQFGFDLEDVDMELYEKTWSPSVASSLEVLGDMIGMSWNNRGGTFNFMALPTELGSDIIDMVFSFAPSGVCLDGDCTLSSSRSHGI